MDRFAVTQPSRPPLCRWAELPLHRFWLRQHGQQLLDFYRAARIESGGFGALDGHGRLPPDTRPDTLITSRMTHVYALAALAGVPGSAPLAAHGVAGLADTLRDPGHGGWLAGAPASGVEPRKQCYLHVFVALGAATAHRAGVERADALLGDALTVLETHFWCDAEQAFFESFDRDWQTPAAYRGANSNMHGVELCLALADILDNDNWHQRALAIAERIIHQYARNNGYYVIEHFDAAWRKQPHFNRDAPDDGFYPFGVTPGHGFEWARLLLHLEAGLAARGQRAPSWLLEDAKGLFDAALRDGWQADSRPGFVYTLDWDGRACSTRRRHWVHAEAVAAAAALAKRTGENHYEQWYRRVWDFIETTFIDHKRGSWRQELDAKLSIDASAGDAKPDLYHAYQATLLPLLPLTPNMAVALST